MQRVSSLSECVVVYNHTWQERRVQRHHHKACWRTQPARTGQSYAGARGSSTLVNGRDGCVQVASAPSLRSPASAGDTTVSFAAVVTWSVRLLAVSRKRAWRAPEARPWHDSTCRCLLGRGFNKQRMQYRHKHGTGEQCMLVVLMHVYARQVALVSWEPRSCTATRTSGSLQSDASHNNTLSLPAQ